MMNIGWNHQALGDASTTEAPDPAFYQLAAFHAPALILAPLSPRLPAPIDLARCTLMNVWHIAGKSLQVIYRAPALRGGPDQIVHVQFLAAGAPAAPAGGIPLPEWDARAWVFPSDPLLPQLPAMIDRPALSARLGQYLGQAIDPAALGWRVLSYLPGERCTLMYRQAAGAPLAVGKLQRGDAALAAHRRVQQLWDLPARRFQIARPLGADAAIGARWEAIAPGERLEERFVQLDFRTFAQPIVAALASLHAAALADLPANGVEQILRRMGRKALRRIRDTLGPLGETAGQVFQALEQQAGELPQRAPCTIHGDFHIANILLDGATPVFIDLDSLALGDPAYDLALFGSRMLLLALVRGERLAEAADLAASLPAAYAAAGGAPIPPHEFAWYMAAMLVGRQMKTCIRHRAPGLGVLCATLLGYAQQTLAHEQFTEEIVMSHPNFYN